MTQTKYIDEDDYEALLELAELLENTEDEKPENATQFENDKWGIIRYNQDPEKVSTKTDEIVARMVSDIMRDLKPLLEEK